MITFQSHMKAWSIETTLLALACKAIVALLWRADASGSLCSEVTIWIQKDETNYSVPLDA